MTIQLYDVRKVRYLPQFQLFFNRIAGASSCEATKQYVPLLEDMGINGMSDDESEPGESEGQRRYRIKEPSFRNPGMKHFLRVFDSLYIGLRKSAGQQYSQGNWPRIRLPDESGQNRIDTALKYVPKGMPINFYDENWLRTLLTHQEEKVAPQKRIVSWQHTQETLE